MLTKPTVWLNNVLEIDKRLLYRMKVKALILDLDNTLSLDGSPAAELGVMEWLGEMRALNVKMLIVSNNTKKRVEPLAEQLGIDFLAYGCKPLPFKINKAVKALTGQGVLRSQIAIVGDQILTDVIGGNLSGIKTVLVQPFHIEGSVLFKCKRMVETVLFKRDFSEIKRL